MKQKRYTEEQIVYALKQVGAGEKITDLCRQMGVSEATFYNWGKKYCQRPRVFDPLSTR